MSEAAVADEPAVLQQPASEIHDLLAPAHLCPVQEPFAAAASKEDVSGPPKSTSPEPDSAVAPGQGATANGELVSDGLADPLDGTGDEASETGGYEEEWEDDEEGDDDESAYEVALEGLSDQTLRAGNGKLALSN